MKEIRWLGSSLNDLRAMPEEVRGDFGHGLCLAQGGEHPLGAKVLSGYGSGVVELIERHDGDTYRAVYTVRYRDVLYVLHCFQKKSPRGSELPKLDRITIESRLKDARKDAEGK
ncbi:MAG: type II toxin-antitoxin system RelE/ParE family toxin [Sphingomonadaceae bacterium]|nr:type II toxin-antitoxin system RelE/ParE family toxin [Sphingomonadaceae bacterium]